MGKRWVWWLKISLETLPYKVTALHLPLKSVFKSLRFSFQLLCSVSESWNRSGLQAGSFWILLGICELLCAITQSDLAFGFGIHLCMMLTSSSRFCVPCLVKVISPNWQESSVTFVACSDLLSLASSRNSTYCTILVAFLDGELTAFAGSLSSRLCIFGDTFAYLVLYCINPLDSENKR